MKIYLTITFAISLELAACLAKLPSGASAGAAIEMVRGEAKASATLSEPNEVDFENDLIPMFTKLGCNAGKCHGSSIGRGGFKLSLYGGTPRIDYDEIVHRLGGRRINFSAPEESLVFLKPAEYVEHGGGAIFDEQDQYAQSLLKWIEQGAPFSNLKQLERITVKPDRIVAAELGTETVMEVTAHFDDGSTREVTGLTRFLADDASAVMVDEGSATLKVIRPGRHIVIARYSTEVIPVELVLPVSDSAVSFPSDVTGNYIDEALEKALAEMRLPMSPAVDDAAFVRRITLDLTGRLPDFEDPPAEGDFNRETLIDALLKSDEFVDYYALKFAKLFRIQSKVDKNRVTTTPQAAAAFHGWLVEQLQQNVGYDQIARAIITAEGDSAEYGPAAFFTAVEDPRLQTEFTSEVFMGSRMKCANCHNHPLDHWTQDDFHGLTSMFAKLTRSRVIRFNPLGKNIHPNTGEEALMKIPGGDYLSPKIKDGRTVFADWLVDSNNPYFAKAIVNRLWKSLMGRGLVEPVDDFRSTNPATHPVLLERLSKDFIEHGYDIRHTLKVIAMSSAYRRASNPLDGNQTDLRFYSHARRKPLEPEVLADAISDVLGIPVRYGTEQLGTRAVELGDGSISSDSLDILGRCDRTNSCEGAPSPVGPLAQKLHLLNGALLNDRIGSNGGRLQRLIQSKMPPLEIVMEFYKVALNRRPNQNEMDFLQRWIDSSKASQEQQEVLEDVVWSILTCREFVNNH